jgi:hypothetical protein
MGNFTLCSWATCSNVNFLNSEIPSRSARKRRMCKSQE